MDKNTAQTGESTEKAGSSTASGLVELLDSKLGRLFAAAKSETFESGFESGFSAELKSLVHRYGDDAIISLANFIILINKSTSPVVAAEALRAIGEIEDSLSYDARRSLLERSLKSSSPVS